MKKINSNKLIAKFYSAIGKEWVSNLSFPITSLCLCTDRVENTEKFYFSVPWKSKISKSSNSSELETFKSRRFEGEKNRRFFTPFKSRRFEGFANIENKKFSVSLNSGKIQDEKNKRFFTS